MRAFAFTFMLLGSSAAALGVEAPSWLDAFAPLPGARELCSQNVMGQDNGTDRVEINYTVYTSTRRPAEAVKLLARSNGEPWKAGQDAITIKRDRGRKVLTVSPASAAHAADCGVRPGREARSLIMVSELVGGQDPEPDSKTATPPP